MKIDVEKSLLATSVAAFALFAVGAVAEVGYLGLDDRLIRTRLRNRNFNQFNPIGFYNGAVPTGAERSSLDLTPPLAERPMPERAASVR